MEILKKIGNLQTMAAGRCRERLEQAALRAKGCPGSKKEDVPSQNGKEYGVTSLLKRRHGL